MWIGGFGGDPRLGAVCQVYPYPYSPSLSSSYMCSVPPSGGKQRVGRRGAVHLVPFAPYVPYPTLTLSCPSPGHVGRLPPKNVCSFQPKTPQPPRPLPIVGVGEQKALPAPN